MIARLRHYWRCRRFRQIEQELLQFYRDDCARARKHQHKPPDWTEWLRMVFR